jgi:asparagine synthase (glutamine-hydrolysing)
MWQRLFGALDSEHVGHDVEWRHPYLDLRVLSFLLSVPPVPWARGKLLLRAAMRGRLPDSILTRAKVPLAKDPIVEAVMRSGLPPIEPSDRLKPYVDIARFPRGVIAAGQLDAVLAVHALDHWLAGR